jgi:glycosyltransferase involved in cell wall biosynthesis
VWEGEGEGKGEGGVEFVGRVDGEAKWGLFERADLLVFPGYQPEGLPLVILEAMAAGLPVVSTDTGAVRDVVVDGVTGLIVDKRNPAALAAAVRRLAGDSGLRRRLGEAGRERYLAEFTEERCARRLVSLFDIARRKD